jgi:hypothetical protein
LNRDRHVRNSVFDKFKEWKGGFSPNVEARV